MSFIFFSGAARREKSSQALTSPPTHSYLLACHVAEIFKVKPNAEVEGTRILRNVSNYTPKKASPHPGSNEFSNTAVICVLFWTKQFPLFRRIIFKHFPLGVHFTRSCFFTRTCSHYPLVFALPARVEFTRSCSFYPLVFHLPARVHFTRLR